VYTPKVRLRQRKSLERHLRVNGDDTKEKFALYKNLDAVYGKLDVTEKDRHGQVNDSQDHIEEECGVVSVIESKCGVTLGRMDRVMASDDELGPEYVAQTAHMMKRIGDLRILMSNSHR
jgi:hypothetical protein